MLRVPIPTQSEFCQLFNAMDTEPKKQSDHVARFSTEFSAAKKARELPVEIVKPATASTEKIAQKRNPRKLTSS
jgi:hypothetical protein